MSTAAVTSPLDQPIKLWPAPVSPITSPWGPEDETPIDFWPFYYGRDANPGVPHLRLA